MEDMQGTLLGRRGAALVVLGMGMAALVTAILAVHSEAAPQCFGKPATIVGTNGNDRITGTTNKDVIVAKDGNDTIQSKSNDDRVCLGDGNDFAGTSRGFDKIDGGDGEDEIHGGGFRGRPDPGDGDLIIGGPDDDFLDGTRGELKDKIRAGPGDDFLQGGEFADGGDGNDRIFAESGNDMLLGGAGNDRLFGHFGQDKVSAGAGNDFVDGVAFEEGVAQKDTIYCGAGFDTVIADRLDSVFSDCEKVTRV
jgi:Ca2+-binding RTX toxin-like protein